MTAAPSRYNSKWSRAVQGAMGTAIYCAWLGGFSSSSATGQVGRLLSLEELGTIFSGAPWCPQLPPPRLSAS